MSIIQRSFGVVSTNSGSESWMLEYVPDFSSVDAQAVVINFALTVEAPGTTDREVGVRIGGSSGMVDGYKVATVLVPAGSTTLNIPVARAVIRGKTTPIKMTMRSMVAGQSVGFSSTVLSIVTVESIPTLLENREKQDNDIGLYPKGVNGAPEYDVTEAGDWRLVSGMEALEQNLTRRFLTILRGEVRGKSTKSDLDAASVKLTEEALKDPRVLRVVSSVVSAENNQTTFKVTITPKKDINRAIPIQGTV